MKKNVFILMMIVLLLSVAFVSCTNDNATKKNEIVYNSTSYELSKGYLENEFQTATSPATYYFVVVLNSSAVTYSGSTGKFSGTGNGIALGLYTSSSTDRLPGTYSFATSNALHTFDLGMILINFDWNTLKSTAIGDQITSGTVKVKKSGTDYEITLDGMVTDGSNVTVYYKGSIVAL